MNGLTPNTPNNGQYVLSTDGTVTETIYLFPHPDPVAVGTLPDKFTLTVQMKQNAGDSRAFYGLAFRFKEDSSGVYSYAFVVNSSGNYHVWKFDPNAKIKPTPMDSGPLPAAFHSGLNQSNTLEVSVQGNNFSFKVNGAPVQLSGGRQSLSDSPSAPYTGGLLALLVSGPSSQFTVTQLQLAIP